MNADATGLPEFIVYSRPGCHLCELLVEALLQRIRGRGSVTIRNIDTREEWRSRYGLRIPVVECNGGIVCEATLDPAAIEDALSAAEPAERV